MRKRTRYVRDALREGTNRVHTVASLVSLVTGVALVALADLSPWAIAVILLAVLLIALAEGTYRLHATESEALAEQTRLREADRFRRFALQFSGWLKSHEINAPADLTSVLGEDYEGEQRERLLAEEISWANYEVSIAPFTKRKEWLRELRADYQRNWRAEVKQQLAWAKDAEKMDGKDLMATLYVDGFYKPDEVAEIAETVRRIAGRL